MGRRGAAPRSDADKAARGETRPCRETGAQLVDFPLVAKCPKPPAYLNRWAKQLWNEVAPHLFAQRRLTEADIHAMSHMCQLHGEIVDGYKRKNAPTASMLNSLRMYFVEFGMTPAARLRLTAPRDDKGGNPFKRNGKPKD